MPPNVPRSRRWNHAAFTLTMATAPKLWKYMFTRVEQRESSGTRPAWASFGTAAAVHRAHDPRSPSPSSRGASRWRRPRIVFFPPSRSVSGPLMMNARCRRSTSMCATGCVLLNERLWQMWGGSYHATGRRFAWPLRRRPWKACPSRCGFISTSTYSDSGRDGRAPDSATGDDAARLRRGIDPSCLNEPASRRLPQPLRARFSGPLPQALVEALQGAARGASMLPA